MWSKEQVLTYGIAFAVVWAVAVSTFISQIEAMPHIAQFILATAVWTLIPSFVFGKWADGEGFKIWIRKATGFFLMFNALDLLAPPLAVNMQGTINASTTLAGAAVDVVIADLWAGFGLTGFTLWLFTYPIAFILLVAVSTFLLTKKQIWNILKR